MQSYRDLTVVGEKLGLSTELYTLGTIGAAFMHKKKLWLTKPMFLGNPDHLSHRDTLSTQISKFWFSAYHR